MADLNPLIRMRKHIVDQKQKFLAELYRQAEELEGQKTALQTQLEDERANMDAMDEHLRLEAMTHFGLYAQGVRTRISDIDGSIEQLEMRIEVARADMSQAYNELKKIEITQERREDEETKALNKKESAELDDIAIEGFRRKQEEGA